MVTTSHTFQSLLSRARAALLLLWALQPAMFRAQPTETDSLVNHIRRMKADTAKVNAMNGLAWTWKYEFPEKSMVLSHDAISLANELHFDAGAADAYKTSGILFDVQGNFPRSIAAYDSAIVYYKKVRDELGIARVEVNIGMLYRRLTRNEEAIKKFDKSLRVFRKHGYTQGAYIALSNLAVSYNELQRYEKALENTQKAYLLMKELGIEDPNIYGNLGNSYHFLNQPDDAIRNYKKAIALDKSPRAAAWLHNLGLSYESRKQYEKAFDYYRQALERHPEIYQEMRTRHQLSKLYRKLGKYEEALYELEEYVVIRDSILTLETSNKLSELTERYDAEKRQLEIESLQEQQHIKDKVIRREKQQKYLYAGSGALFLALGAFLLVSLRQKNKANHTILEQKAVSEHQRKTVDAKNREILDSITYAERLQKAILPSTDYWRETFPDSFILYRPKDIVAGDFYWMDHSGSSGQDIVYFAAADCTGHGVPGALVSVVCRNALNRAIGEFGISDPGAILDKVRALIAETFQQSTDDVNDGMDISLCRLDLRTNELSWTGANIPLWYTEPGSETLLEIRPNKQPIGAFATSEPFTSHHIRLGSGSCLYLFSDGLAHQFGGPRQKKYTSARLKSKILEGKHLPMMQQGAALENDFLNWKGDTEQVDDVCLIGIRIG